MKNGTIHVLQMTAHDYDMDTDVLLAAAHDPVLLEKTKKRAEQALGKVRRDLPRMLKNLGYEKPSAADLATIGLTTDDFPIAWALVENGLLHKDARVLFHIKPVPLLETK